MNANPNDDATRALATLMGANTQQQTRTVTLPDGATAYEHTFTPPNADDLPVLDWRPVQYAMYDISDWIEARTEEIIDMLHQLGFSVVSGVENDHRSRLRAAKTRARLSTQVRPRRRR